MAPTLFRLIARELEEKRDGNSFESSGLSSSRLYIIIFSAAGALLLGVILWYAIRTLRRRMQGKTYSRRDAPLISVQGDGGKVERPVTRDREPSSSASVVPPTKGPPLPHTYIASTVVLPQRAPISPEGITKYNSASGVFTRPFVPTPDSPYTPNRLSSPSHRLSFMFPSQRSSYASTTDGDAAVLSAFPPPPCKRFSGLSALTARALMSPQPAGQLVRQVFTPVLPDELRLTRLGECLTVVKSFDDGWCIASRARYCPPYPESSCTSKVDSNGVELGAVPAWCFIKPVNGLRSERPFRRSSLGITMDVDIS
ncbi:hypothetical protein PILCRDRAFT_399459 [Piloderma croceum F 1598]|uniref:SH3 domain-containing protein n=1 Tax=Piloderma croceum (strain F 1598) TaxID=765440 RepID=A0A0C3C3I0_PILCF|nr:hypothetical protein PILCRDRAFT_399459 [Piloderma croceum F 1598]